MPSRSLRFSRSRFQMGSVAGLLFSAALSSCTVTPLGATDDGIAKARAASAPGAEEYEHECASCHGKRGEGLTTAPAVMGLGALPTFSRDDSSSSSSTFATSGQIQGGDNARVPGQAKRDAFRTAQDVYDYVSSRMPLPKSRAGTLKPDEYWAITNYMLVANGTSVPPGGVTEANAKSVTLR
jgi:mono/diheme cytochrome c family protein